MTGARPGVDLARRPLHLFFLVDGSGSMRAGARMSELNAAIREALPQLAELAEQNPFVELLARAVVFSDGARWHVEVPTLIGALHWTDVEAGGFTDLGAGLRALTGVLRMPPMQPRAYPPVIVLLSDGRPTDDVDTALAGLLAEPWGRRAVRLAIAIGPDADLGVLQQFIADPQLRPLSARDPGQLAYLIRFATVAASRLASAPTADAAFAHAQLVEAGASGPDPGDGILAW
jgi:uncharacterized protein YegL